MGMILGGWMGKCGVEATSAATWLAPGCCASRRSGWARLLSSVQQPWECLEPGVLALRHPFEQPLMRRRIGSASCLASCVVAMPTADFLIALGRSPRDREAARSRERAAHFSRQNLFAR